MFSVLLQIATEPATADSAVDFTWLFLKMMLALGIVVIVAILLLKFVVPRLGVTKRYHSGKYFHILGRHMLEPKKSLYLTKVGVKYLVLGVSESNINLITELTKEEAEAASE